jgi:hypothetical protein
VRKCYLEGDGHLSVIPARRGRRASAPQRTPPA